jgi:hypothetical protein
MCGLLLSACTSLSTPGGMTFSEEELQTQLARRFPIQRSLLDNFDLRLADPLLRLNAQAKRLSTQLTVQASDRRAGRSLQGRLTLGYALRFEHSDSSIRLVQPRVESVEFDAGQGALPPRSESTQRLVVALAERVLDDMVLYRVPAERLSMLRAIGFRPAALNVTPAGVEITIEPVP